MTPLLRFMTSMAACLALGTPLAAQGPATTDRVDTYLRQQMEKYQIPGLSVAVVKNGTIVHLKGYGRANLEFDVPTTAETVFQIYSVTKIFAGLAIMTLVEDGRLALDTPVTDLVAEAPRTWSGIRVRHLLSHTSGLPELSDSPRYGALTQEQRDGLTNVDMLKIAIGAPLRSEPGAKGSYHRFGYTLIGLIVERVTGKTFEAYLQERIYKPTGMTRTRFGDVEAVVPQRAPAYLRSEGGFKINLYRFGYGNPGAGLNSSATDLAQLMASLQSRRLLGEASLDVMWAGTTLKDGTTHNYGLGWSVETREGRAIVGHEGGGSAWVAHYPSERLSVVVLCNLNGARADGIPHGLAGIYLD